MLYISPETLQYLRHEQARAEAAERRRASIEVRKPGRKLHHKTFERLVDNVSRVLKAGVPTKFEYEGACRHGLRVALIFQGWSWEDADGAAVRTVQAALHRIGAERPTWNEGQVDFATAHRVERHGCARCGKPIPEERKNNGTPAKYCSSLCGVAANQAKGRASGERVSLAQRLASLALKHEQTVRERSGPCETCGTPVITARAGHRYCSLRCSNVGKTVRETKACASCGRAFRPRLRKGGEESTYCTKSCYTAAQLKPIEARDCRQCGASFTPEYSRERPFCSLKCSGASTRKSRPETSCPTCKTVFRWRYASKPQTFCSAPCSPRSPQYVGRSAFKCEEAV